ncbi:hypothetical protein WJX81_003819 [Elliptochloris bilobata]|uniref:Signal recognition particle 14 kDa protein n=1 Tax=Elliptochloris bilobata TaxID=381761 RepID=A0AAW1S8V7_9CHLO
MVALEADKFLNELGRLFERTKVKGSVSITMKRSNLKPRKSRHPNSDAVYHCLIRATDGKKKVTTTVSGKDHVRFQGSYGTILKAHMDNLKRREKTKSAKAVKKPGS